MTTLILWFNTFGFSIEKPRLEIYTGTEWEDRKRSGDAALGLYKPSAKLATVNKDHPLWISTVFHELFGHGLYYEYSLCAKGRVGFGLTDTEKGDSEGFAVWMEQFLCKKLELNDLYEGNIRALPEFYLDSWRILVDVEEQMSRMGMLAQMGFPVYVPNENLITSLDALAYTSSARLLLRCGSPERPFVNLCAVEGNASRDSPWLRIRSFSQDEFSRRLISDYGLRSAVQHSRLLRGDERLYRRLRMWCAPKPI